MSVAGLAGVAALVVAVTVWASARTAGPRQRAWLVLAASLLLVAHGSLYLPCTVDDAYIFYRYASNLAAGQGAVYNPGERVEGYTSPAWLGLLAAARLAGLDPIPASKLLGLVAGLGTLALAGGTSRSLGRSPGESAPSLAFLAGAPLFAGWLVAGMDTPLHALLVSGFGYLLARAARGGEMGPAAARRLAILLGAAPWVRPEGMLLVGAALLGAGYLGLGRYRRRWAAGALAGLGPLVILRLLYYGDWVPNTFHAKVKGGLEAWWDGLYNLYHLAVVLGAGVLVLGVLGWLRGGRFERVAGALLAVHLAYVVAVGGDVLKQRIHVAYLGLLAILVEGGLLALLGALKRRGSRLVAGSVGRGAFAALAALYLATSLLEGWSAIHRNEFQMGVSYVTLNSRHVRLALTPLGRWLAENAREGDAVAIDDIGAVGYTSGLRVIDLYGLVDRDIAERLRARESTRGGIAEVVFGRRPRWIVFRGPPERGYWLRDEEVTRDPRLGDYEVVERFSESWYKLTVMRRRGEG